MIGYLSLIFFACLALGVPIAFALGVSGGAYIVYWEGLGVELLSRRIFYALNSFPLLAIPLFTMIGILTDRSGMLPQLTAWLHLLVGWMRGGVAYINVLSSLFFSGVSGTAVSDVAGMGRIEIQIMRRAGYTHEFAGAVTAAAAVLGPIIPPSVAMVIYALAAGKVSIAGLFLGGFLPGLLIAAFLLAMCWRESRNMPFSHAPLPSAMELARATARATPFLVLPLIIIGGITGGIVTVTESAGIGVAYVLVIGFFVTKQLKLRDVYEGMLVSAETSAVLSLLMGAGAIIAWILTRNEAAEQLIQFLAAFSQDPTVFLLMVVAALFVIGLFMDATAMIIALAPLLAPVAAHFGVDNLHFGLIFILTVMVGMITPPVGILLFVTCSVGEIKFERLARAIVPFVVVEVMVVILLVFFPSLTTWLPHLFGFK